VTQAVISVRHLYVKSHKVAVWNAPAVVYAVAHQLQPTELRESARCLGPVTREAESQPNRGQTSCSKSYAAFINQRQLQACGHGPPTEFACM
jgi:hypothetical protein